MKVLQITNDLNPKILEKHLDPSIDFEFRELVDKKEIIEAAKDIDILVSIYSEIDREVLESLPKLKLIALGSIGYNSVDIEGARDLGVLVSNNPNYCVEEVADHTLALMLDRLRRLSNYNESVKREYKWDYNLFGNSLRRMSAQTVGLIGFGEIPRRVARRLAGFGCKVMAYDPFAKEEVFQKHGVIKASMEEIQKEADIISLHVPLTDATYHMVNQEFIDQLKKPIILINTSRGSVIDEKILPVALKEGKFLGLGLDVLESEDPNLKEIEFIEDDRVVLSPHTAFYSKESSFEADYNVAQYINSFVKGEHEKLPIVNKEEK